MTKQEAHALKAKEAEMRNFIATDEAYAESWRAPLMDMFAGRATPMRVAPSPKKEDLQMGTFNADQLAALNAPFRQDEKDAFFGTDDPPDADTHYSEMIPEDSEALVDAPMPPVGPKVRVRAHHHETGEVLPMLYEGPFSFEVLERCVNYQKANHHHTHLFYKDLRFTFESRREDWEFQSPRFFTKSVNEWETKWTVFIPNPYDVELAGSVRNYALYHALMNEVFVDVTDKAGHYTKFEVRF